MTTDPVRKDDFMPPLNLPRIRFFGRPIKPVALAIALGMLIVSVTAFTNTGVLDGNPIADWLTLPSLAVASVLTLGWWRRSQRLAEYGLIGAFAIWVLRMCLAFTLIEDPVREGALLSACWAIVAGGSYLLEKADPAAMGWTDLKE